MLKLRRVGYLFCVQTKCQCAPKNFLIYRILIRKIQRQQLIKALQG
ncbi:unnamed protein product [Moneuplotes crassus]|uniref:Uncharacterized protein n=1 Tax=Euplotes crassus TaxID=5936 RepID=A0AAD1Y146_EUPCR|nr:unnamed protein product [Moneuplotes crassus]